MLCIIPRGVRFLNLNMKNLTKSKFTQEGSTIEQTDRQKYYWTVSLRFVYIFKSNDLHSFCFICFTFWFVKGNLL